MPPLLAVFTALAVLDVTGVTAGWPALEWVTKPLLAPVLALYLWSRTGTRGTVVIAGLALATAGDVALLFPGDTAFACGLGCFLGAQLCWTAAYLRAGALRHLRRRPVLCAVHGVVWPAATALLVAALGPVLGTAAALYALALIAMALTARVLGRRAARGGLVFVASDLLVGLGAAGHDFAGRGPLVMVTYALALALLVTAYVSFATTTAPPPRAKDQGAVPTSVAEA